MSDLCNHCKHELPPSLSACPHCAWPGVYPNVRAVDQAEEREAFQRRHDAATASMTRAGTDDVGRRLEAAVASSQAVIARSLNEAERITTSDKEGYTTFYELVKGGVRIPDGSEWTEWRGIADSFFFPNYREHVRFASLTLDGRGLAHYGDAFLVLRSEMIAHRTTVFEANSAVVARDEDFTMRNFKGKLRGRRVAWGERGKLAVVKHQGELTPSTGDGEFPAMIQQPDPGGDGDKDRFLEAHIYGSMTARTLERVVVQKKRVRAKSRIKVLRERCAKLGVRVEET